MMHRSPLYIGTFADISLDCHAFCDACMLKGNVARSNLTFKKDTDTVSDCNGGSTDDGHSESSG